MGKVKISKGRSSPLGIFKEIQGGCNFALVSECAEKITLCLFQPHKKSPFLEVPMHRSDSIWHVYVDGFEMPCEYAFRVDGTLVLDPYAKELNTSLQWGNTKDYHPKGVIHAPASNSLHEDKKPNIPLEKLIIYEMHVRAFTQDPSSHVSHKGTFLGVIEKIPYLKELGINAIELLPICEFNECEYPKKDPETGQQLYNFWGYSTINFFTPMHRFAHQNAVKEFKMMVHELHNAGIEVILDMVYNHTGEGPKDKPILSFSGIDNKVYYLHDQEGNSLDFTGTGNTVNCNHPIVIQFILDSLKYWVTEMHVDGFRFDLASIFVRGESGIPLEDPPFLKAIQKDPILSRVKLIAEPWDAGGLYHVGQFPRFGPWSEWNGKYRDAVRKFIKGTDGCAGEFATALCGSQDLYGNFDGPANSINFIIAHDGYTLYDLVCYQEKHNERNGEENRDGNNDNMSWNCGEEGPTKNREIIKLREQQVRNLHMALFISRGIPMILMGDEHLQSKQGNNNTWCQDNELNWMQWKQSAKDFFRFTHLLIRLRKLFPIFEKNAFLTSDDVEWHGHKPHEPDWSEQSRFVAYTIKDEHHTFYIAFNAHFLPAHIVLPKTSHKHWYRIIDTSLPSPDDFIEHPHEHHPLKSTYQLPPHSALLLTQLD